jgi:tRNA modification GTPase
MYDDTISAISTPPGEGGVGIVRISGPESARVASRIFRRGSRLRPVDVSRLRSHHLHYGHVIEPVTDRVVDEVLLARMAAPRTYTREDIVEIYCHGGPVPLREVLRLTFDAGAREAEPGEFTLRAFLNGRIDLSQAEAVMAVVSARTSESLELAIDELRGSLTRRLGPARAALLEALAYMDAAADFPEDEIPPVDVPAVLARAERDLAEVVDSSQMGLLYREGVQIAIVGRPNVGKSSLLNTLLRSERAIVTEIAGTTRDVITETINLRGIPATLLDTAGIADTEDVIERMGIDRSQRALETAGVAIFVLDGSEPLTGDDRRVTDLLGRRFGAEEDRRLIIALNKRDLPARYDHAEIRQRFPDAPVVEISTIRGEGVEALEDVVFECLRAQAGEAREPAMVTLRQRQALVRALDHVRSARQALDEAIPLDLIAVDVRAAMLSVGEITGEQVSESVLTEIFSRFCIGK